MLHHISLPVRDIAQSTALYDACLAKLGVRRVASASDFSGYGVEPGRDKLALKQANSATNAGPKFHLALTAPNPAAVDAFHRVALACGATDDGAPGLRPHYGPNYYAAFIQDLDGHRIEAVFNEPTPT